MIHRNDVTVADSLNTPQPGVYVTVRDVDGDIATIYSDDGVTVKANPLTTGLDGAFEYWAAEGAYTEEYRLSLGGQPKQVVGVNLTVDDVIRAELASTADDKGAALVGKGSTTLAVAVPITAKEKGATGGGSVSDTTSLAALATALAAQDGGVAQFTPGTYLATASIGNSQTWRGEGPTATSGIAAASTIKKNANGPTVTLDGYTAGLSEFHVDGNKASFTGPGVSVKKDRVSISHVSVEDAETHSFLLSPAAGGNINLWRLDAPISLNPDGDGIRIEHLGNTADGTWPAGPPDANAGLCTHAIISNSGGRGIYAGNSIDNVFIAPVIQSCDDEGIYLDVNAKGYKVFGPYLEANGVSASGYELIIKDGSTQHVIIGNRYCTPGAVDGYKDENAPGQNYIVTYDDGLGRFSHWGEIAVWNRDFAATGDVQFQAYLGSGADNVFNLVGSISGTNGGTLSLQTKRDGDTAVTRLSIDRNGLAVIQNSSRWLFGKGASDTTTPGTTVYADGTPRIDLVGSGTGATTMLAFYNGGGFVGGVSTSGSTTTYATSSDERLKENIADADDAGALIDAIRVRQFDWKASGEHQAFGLVAQELRPLIPEAVADGEYLGVDYGKLVPALLKELQSLRARVAALEAA